MNEVTITMALLDYLPVLFFGIGMIYLLRIGYQFLGRNLYTAMAGGSVLCFVGGFYKATSKLMEAASGYCLAALETSQFIMLAPGFTLLFIAALGLLRSSSSKGVLAVAGMEFWKIPFIVIMTLANLGFLAALAVFAGRNKVRWASGFYVLSALSMLFMGYLSTQPFITAGTHWLAQGINSFVQFFAMAGHITLFRELTPVIQPSPAFAGK